MTWHRPEEGLTITTKGRREERGGKMVNFFERISNNKDAVICHDYTWTINGPYFSNFINKKAFPKAFKNAIGREINISFLWMVV